ncbi:hypothetical protein [Streptosporangium saharense]|uniref:Uncharacterized protein n=1 Tax=Streptosporangium saharense TaxID=1706840 RepID=A0A7W7QPF5_9ACTN|nr:hypothetical protein [Streptosporangium saharense]MBB4917332.1 hypothetical protein [Streptosporangium saharense]
MSSVDQPSSWFDALSRPQRVTAVVFALVGSVGGAAYLLLEPPTTPAALFLIFAYMLFSLMVLNGIPRVRLWLDGRGYLLYAGIFALFKGAAGGLQAPALRIGVFAAGALILAYLIVRIVRIEQGRKQRIDHTTP